jgi:EAL domain-containing protein (putative c-di-GMP-specific phosphodiesterase class I)
MTSSAGLTWLAPGPVDVSQALRDADLALYASKERGRNCLTVADDGLRAVAEQRLVAEQNVRSALDEDRLRVHLQPFTHLASGEVVGAEALLRVVQPDGSELLPAGFIEVAAEIGLLVDVDAFVLRTAAGWLRERAAGGGPDLLRAPGFDRLSVNVSAGTLRSAWFGDVLDEVLTGLSTGGPRLALEITEGTLLEADEKVSGMLDRIRRSGADLGLDDFGTGYSSLAQLQRVPVDFVKLDRSFTTALDEGDGVNARAMVRAVLDLTRALGLDVVAEGIETATQRDALVDIGFTTGQGWLFARAEPALRSLVPAPRAAVADVPADAA